KLDGARVQIHHDPGQTRVFSRRLNEITASIPEVVELAARLAARGAILDGEVIAVDSNGKPLAFQEVMRRFGRVRDVERLRVEQPLGLFVFDLIALDGELLIDVPYAERHAALSALAAKAVQSRYTPGVRGRGWLKIKRALTLDLVIVAADWGYGRRKGWLSNYHLAARDEQNGRFLEVGKTF